MLTSSILVFIHLFSVVLTSMEISYLLMYGKRERGTNRILFKDLVAKHAVTLRQAGKLYCLCDTHVMSMEILYDTRDLKTALWAT